MSKDDKVPDTTIDVPAPRSLTEGGAGITDARTTEVLRALRRAKGTLGGPEVATSFPSAETMVWELQALTTRLERTSPVIEDLTKRLAACAGMLERVVLVSSEELGHFQRRQDDLVRKLRESAHGLKLAGEGLTTSRAWWTKHVCGWTLVLMVLLGAALGLAGRAYTQAQSTHDILEQILANQAKAQAAPAGKRR
jgi:hypothetical protein